MGSFSSFIFKLIGLFFLLAFAGGPLAAELYYVTKIIPKSTLLIKS